jgi:diguanylate cyclase (GGDEF)-like protein
MMETNATVVFSDRPAADELGSIQEIDGDRVVTEIIGLPFTDGSVRVASSTDGSIGVFGDQPARYGLLLALGTVLLALAGWTFRVERRQLERRATTDELTGLINRREFERVSEAELDVADRFNSGLCVMVVDLNGFKQVNDTLGHQFGDLVLAASSERLVAAVRDTDVVGRWGGDEFVILLPGLADRGAVRKSAERIWQSLAGSPVVGDTVMTASIGAAMFPRHGITLDSLMRAADVAMYEAKSTGVSHRIADTIVVSDSDGDDDAAPSEGAATISTDQYAGPDRRHSPVPPPPSPSEELKEPTGLPRPGSDGRVDQPSKIS